jgi:hypothetical protein
MDAEYMAVMENKMWHLVPPERGQNLIDCKWIWKIKRKADGTIDRYKGRLDAQGYISKGMALTVKIPLVVL